MGMGTSRSLHGGCWLERQGTHARAHTRTCRHRCARLSWARLCWDLKPLPSQGVHSGTVGTLPSLALAQLPGPGSTLAARAGGRPPQQELAGLVGRTVSWGPQKLDGPPLAPRTEGLGQGCPRELGGR